MEKSTLVIKCYPLPPSREFDMLMPQGAQILHVGIKDGRPYVWALIDQSKPSVKHFFGLATDRQNVPASFVEKGTFIGSVVGAVGGVVAHLFDLGEAPVTAKQHKTEAEVDGDTWRLAEVEA